jgi:protein-L-isoaspartate(D-aspartate) O-methyltransferase
MTSLTIDTTDARSRMVDCQLRPNKVSDSRILGAMRTLPRERFLPPASAALAYADADVPLAGGRCLMEPMALARLVQLADPRPGERVLVVGAGTGYGAAVLAACGASVVALEEAEDLLGIARAVLAELAPGVQFVAGPLAAGWRAGAPYDLVFIEGGFEQLPAVVAGQLRATGGRLVGVRVMAGGIGQAVLGERAGEAPAISLLPAFDCATLVLPSLKREPGFVF